MIPLTYKFVNHLTILVLLVILVIKKDEEGAMKKDTIQTRNDPWFE
jgi:hypothetical protein